MKRTFLLRDADGKNVDVKASLERVGGNRLAHFSLTSQNGCDHERILASAPADVAEDLAALAAVHLMDDASVPMHAAANAVYHMRQGDFPAAHSALNGAGAIEDLYRINGEAQTRYVQEVTGVTSAIHAAASELAAKALRHHERILSAQERQRTGVSTFAFTKRDAESRDEALAELAKLTGDRKPFPIDRAGELSRALPDDVLLRVARKFKDTCFAEAMAVHVEKTCLPAWTVVTDRARAALAKPDYRAEGRPSIDEDDTTFTGFANAAGLTLAFAEDRFRKDPSFKEGSSFYTWTLSRGDAAIKGKYAKGSALAKGLTVEELLENLQSDFSTAENYGLEEFLSEMGYDKKGPNGETVLKNIRNGEKVFKAIASQKEDFVEAFGEDTYRTLMTRVGDSPPMPEDFMQDAPAPRM